jgi:hypothetical protein
MHMTEIKVGDILSFRKESYYLVYMRGRWKVSMFIIKNDKAPPNQNIIQNYSLWLFETDDCEKVE